MITTIKEIILTWLLGIVTFTVLVACIWSAYFAIAFFWHLAIATG